MKLVVGAAGPVGKDVVRELASRGVEVRAMIREFAVTDEVPTRGVTYVQGDLRKPDTLDRALEGVDAVFLVSKEMPGAVEREGALIDAAKRAGNVRIVKQARLFAAPDAASILHRLQYEIVEYLKASGVPYTLIRPQAFMQNLFLDAPTIQADGVIYNVMGDARLAMIDRRDNAAVIATALLDDRHVGHDYAISGPALLTYQEITSQLSEEIDRQVTCIDVPVESMHQALLGMGLPMWFADAYTGIVRFAREGPPQIHTTAAEEILGRPTIPFSTFIADHRAAFKPVGVTA
jgi:uncharacterized protein YbjT (DUF2867 family)